MNVRRLGPRDHHPQRWRNGGGATSELAAEPQAPDWLWRLSIAKVERSGPFSEYRGYDRTIMLLQGRGMELAFDDRCSARIDRLHEPFAFDGGWNTRCRLLDGPVRNMNLIVDRRRGMGSIAVLVPSETATLAVDAPWLSLYCVHGALEVDTPAGEHRLERGDLLRVDDAIGTALVPRDVRRDTMLAVIRVHSREAFSRSAGTVDDERASR